MTRWSRDATRAELDIRKLAVERKDLQPVAVDDWDSRPSRSRTDYGF
jgi:hypothetical protein